jgi:peptidoglycan/xylan/chitin deacetylase (PgdA/CDA1 family)
MSARPGAPGTLLFFWDYDAQWGAERSRLGRAADWGLREMEETDRLLDLHAEHDVPACFAVVGSVAGPGSRPYHDAGQVRRIHEAGHEVASHSHRHEWLPGLSGHALRDTLVRSRDALEQCIGAEVTAFVPPYNQPYDYPAKLSISLSERREANGARVNLPRLCEALGESGYRFCRVAYWPVQQRIAEMVLRRRIERPARLEQIAGVACVRLNTICGFTAFTQRMIDRAASEGGIAVVYGHPHSIHNGHWQDESLLVPLLRRIGELRREGRLRLALPRDLIART